MKKDSSIRPSERIDIHENIKEVRETEEEKKS
jgi:hypothetical protein